METPKPARRTVGLLIDRWDPHRGGAERALDAFVRHLLTRGHRVLVFARQFAAGAPGEHQLVRAGGWLRGTREKRLAGALVAAADSAGCDLTIGIRHLPRVDFFWPHDGSHRAILAARAEHGGAVRAGGRHRVFVELERELVERSGARKIVCVSELVAEEFRRHYPGTFVGVGAAGSERLCVVENGVDLERFHPRVRAGAGAALRSARGVKPNVPVVVFAAREPRRKGFDVLVRALARLGALDWKLWIAGARHAPHWLRAAAAAGLDPQRVDAFEASDSAALFAAGDLCVLPSWRDAWGLVVAEALAVGTPVLTTNTTGAATLLREAAAGEVLPATADAGEWSAALERWLQTEGGPERELAARACVADHGEAAWLARLERELWSLLEAPAR